MFDSLFDQGTDMAVHQFGREANRIGWNGVLSFDVHFPIREGRGYHFKAEIGEEGVPERESSYIFKPIGNPSLPRLPATG